jgi:N-acetyl-alpha-D-glucosaminyl L-malate synthase BshA
MAEIAESKGLDLLHCHYAIPHSVSAYLAKSMLHPRRLPIVTTLHGTDITLVGSDPSYLPITRFSIDRSDGVTAVSKFLKQETERVLGVRNDIEVIHNFIDSGKYKPLINHPLKKCFAPNNEAILVHVSNFRPVKRPFDVVETFVRVLKELPAVLLMVGDGPERSGTERLVRSHHIERNVHFMGKQGSVEEFIGISDLLLLPSDTESFGLVALEAMSCEVPVVASGVGGVPEVVTDGIDGFLVEPGNIKRMAECSVSVLGDRSRRIEMGRSARKAAMQRFCPKKIISEYEAFYLKTLNQG